MPESLTHAWDKIPAPLRARLAQASTGWRHLALTGAEALRLARAGGDGAASLYALTADLLLWAFGENPLFGPLAVEILSAPDLPLPDAARDALSAVAAHWRAPGEQAGGQAYFERLAARRDTERLADFLSGQVQKDPAGLYWRDKALGLALYCGQGALADALETAALSGLEAIPGLKPVATALTAQAAFLRGDTVRCLDALARLKMIFGPAFAPARAGLALLAAGEDTEALPRLRNALAHAPWQASLALATADALTGRRRALAPPPGPALILLYTWNKAADLDATLTSVFASNLCGARVMVLDNGSTDGTAQVLAAWAGRAGENLLRLDLPVNIGAPAARNWLAATPEAKAAEALVYLDDDVDLPPDWLQRLGAACKAYPGAGVVGCKVADHQAPHLLQNVAGHLVFPPELPVDRPELDFQSLTPNPFRLLDAHLQVPDWGLFDFIGPCASVTGCCHMFTRAALDASFAQGGGFSLALGPSQYDDFERDLRMLAGGRHAVYQGHLRVRHRKRSGIAAQGAEAVASNANGNRYKMQTMHPRTEVAGFISDQASLLGEAMAEALAVLDRAGEPS
ncbi:MAG: glycosyltransferase [Humidesulfovibrio sp.]|nr:glycosyltransferase [Humidesulfovibrio sp.]